MRSFAETFFKNFGAQVFPQVDELVVDLPPDLAGVFGKSRLYLVFPRGAGQDEPRELSPTEDLLVYGSRTFDRMLTLLKRRGEGTRLRWPGRVAIDPANPPVPLPLFNCRVLERRVEIDADRFFVFNFRVAYISDEKQEEFLTVVLDAAGRPRPDLMEMLTNLDQLLTLDEISAMKSETSSETGTVARRSEASSDAGAQFPPDEFSQVAMQQRLAQAGDIARRQADERAAKLEQAIRPRLEKALLRLTTYYRRLLAEVDTGEATKDEAIRAELQQDLTRKIADELERYRLQVTLRPFNYAVALAPFARYRLTLATSYAPQTLELTQNLYTRRLEPRPCHHCREPVDQLALCDRGHLVHAHCLDTCHRCQRDVCLTCGIETCAGCGHEVCGECIASCAYCDRRLCAEHISRCAICGATHCTDHAARCRWCNQTYCHRCVPGNECETCRTAWTGPVTVEVSIPATAGLKIDRYRWRQAQNHAYRVYIGQRAGLLSPLLDWLIVVTGEAGEVVDWRKIGPINRIFRK